MPVPLERADPTRRPRPTAIASPTLRRLTRLMRLGLPVALLLATAVAALGLTGIVLASPGPAPAPAAALTLGTAPPRDVASPPDAAAGSVDSDTPGCATSRVACDDLPRRVSPVRPTRANCCP